MNSGPDNFIRSRHSVREYSSHTVDLEKIKKALRAAKTAPSACNRQGWKTIVVQDRQTISRILKYQNGSKGFRDKIPLLIAVVGDVQSFAYPREHSQMFIDGGLYAMTLMFALHSEGLATCPLSAALTLKQEKMARSLLGMQESEKLILYISVGNYLDEFNVPVSRRYSLDRDVRFITNANGD